MNNDPIFMKVRTTKQLYKALDSYERWQKWTCKNILKQIMSSTKINRKPYSFQDDK